MISILLIIQLPIDLSTAKSHQKKKQGIISLVILLVNMTYYRQGKPLVNPSVIEY